jgi:hypothetical protein
LGGIGVRTGERNGKAEQEGEAGVHEGQQATRGGGKEKKLSYHSDDKATAGLRAALIRKRDAI